MVNVMLKMKNLVSLGLKVCKLKKKQITNFHLKIGKDIESESPSLLSDLVASRLILTLPISVQQVLKCVVRQPCLHFFSLFPLPGWSSPHC